LIKIRELGLQLESGGIQDGYIFCTFKQFDHEIKPIGLNISLADEHYVLVAHGKAQSGM